MIEKEEVLLTKTGKVRKRKPKVKNVYFTQDTEDAIIKYNNEENFAIKNKIYNKSIHYAFYKLSENIIHTFKFYYTEVDNIEDLKYEVISFLLQKINLYNQEKGKAYSYFGTIAKRYLIIYNKKNYKKLLEQSFIENSEDSGDIFNSLSEKIDENVINRSDLLDVFVKTIDSKLFDIFTNEEDVKVADAILEVFKKRENIDIFNKKALFIYIKEITDTNSTAITRVIKIMKNIYIDMLNDKIENHDN